MPANHAHDRQVAIEAACRVAVRMLGSGRGAEAALQFLLDVAARHFALPTSIVGTNSKPSLICNENVLNGSSSSTAEAVRPHQLWSAPILTRQGTVLGEFRVRAPEPDRLDPASSKAMETIARTAAEIMSRSNGLESDS